MKNNIKYLKHLLALYFVIILSNTWGDWVSKSTNSRALHLAGYQRVLTNCLHSLFGRLHAVLGCSRVPFRSKLLCAVWDNMCAVSGSLDPNGGHQPPNHSSDRICVLFCQEVLVNFVLRANSQNLKRKTGGGWRSRGGKTLMSGQYLSAEQLHKRHPRENINL